MTHQFGGTWTEEKLQILERYLKSYLQIFHANQWARKYATYYVDAFAGTGSRTEEAGSAPLLAELAQDRELSEFKRGSATRALDLKPGFQHYIFIEEKATFAAELRERLATRPESTLVIEGDANEKMMEWLASVDWDSSRAVVFLDPYGMQVEWRLIEAIAGTKGIDLWLLFPLGQAVLRLLTKEPPTGGWASRLDLFFGTSAWRAAFYHVARQVDMFSDTPKLERDVNWQAVEEFFIERLKSVFEGVATESRRLYNSKGTVPIYLLLFAASNRRGAKTALKIANHLLKHF